MNDELRMYKDMIPLYLNGRLPAPDREALEQALDRYEELQRDLAELGEIRGAYECMEEEAPAPSHAAFARILDQIRESPDRKATRPRAESSLLSRLRTLFVSPRAAWALCAAQAIVLIVLIFGMPSENRFYTLTDSAIPTDEAIRFNAIFDEDATEREIRSLLNEADVTIVEGPSPSGLYVLEARSAEAPERALEMLRSSPIVRLAERRY